CSFESCLGSWKLSQTCPPTPANARGRELKLSASRFSASFRPPHGFTRDAESSALGVASFPRVSRSFAMVAGSKGLAENRRPEPGSRAPGRKSQKLSDSLNYGYTRVSG